jgi:DnaJ-class molecular chaperone
MNHYDILGVPRDATEKEIRTSYRELARSLHPDKNKFGAELFKHINEAYGILSDPITRKQYDRLGGPAARQTEQQRRPSSSSGESPKERNESQPKKGMESKQRRQQHKSSSSSSSSSSKKKLLIAITCMVCDSIVDKNFYEAPCCGALCCVECATSGFKCLNKSCTSPQTLNDKHHPNRHNKNKNTCWTKSSKFINTQINNITVTHMCGKRIDIDEVNRHELICPKLNLTCIKCSGRGKYTTTGGTEAQCNACNGRQLLVGLDWMKCFKCNGRGAYDSTLKTVMDCSTCQTKGALHGKWTLCFKCQGAGAYDTVNERRRSCEICKCAGAFKGFNVLECSACKGCGCVACNWKGYLPCMCGDLCTGHSNQYTKRYHECIRQHYYESDTSSDL